MCFSNKRKMHAIMIKIPEIRTVISLIISITIRTSPTCINFHATELSKTTKTPHIMAPFLPALKSSTRANQMQILHESIVLNQFYRFPLRNFKTASVLKAFIGICFQNVKGHLVGSMV